MNPCQPWIFPPSHHVFSSETALACGHLRHLMRLRESLADAADAPQQLPCAAHHGGVWGGPDEAATEVRDLGSTLGKAVCRWTETNQSPGMTQLSVSWLATRISTSYGLMADISTLRWLVKQVAGGLHPAGGCHVCWSDSGCMSMVACGCHMLLVSTPRIDGGGRLQGVQGLPRFWSAMLAMLVMLGGTQDSLLSRDLDHWEKWCNGRCSRL